MQAVTGGPGRGLLRSCGAVYLNWVAEQEALPPDCGGELEQMSVELGVQTEVNKLNYVQYFSDYVAINPPKAWQLKHYNLFANKFTVSSAVPISPVDVVDAQYEGKSAKV